jgi:hypothetical protein
MVGSTVKSLHSVAFRVCVALSHGVGVAQSLSADVTDA